VVVEPSTTPAADSTIASNSDTAEIQPESQIAALTPEPAPQATQATQPPQEARPQDTPTALPKTASPDVLFLLAGLGSAVAAYGAGRVR